jgi:hypothetical protein
MKIKIFTLFLASMLMSVMLFAQVTTSGLSGKVVGKDNMLLPGATVVAIHVPTGTKYVTVSNSNGQFSLQGMKSGGPYTVNISFMGYSTSSYRDISLSLGEMYNLSATLNESATSIAEVVIVATKTAFRSLRTGAVSNITATQMKSIPSMNRTLSDYTKLSPFSTGSGSYLGKDAYTSNITVDGANFNNNFGLSSTNLPGASGEPISMEAIDEIQVSVAPFDVRQSNFTGAGINAITKSGTNQFKGSAYTFYRNQQYNGRFGRDSANGNARRYNVSQSSKKTYGFSLGGPIIKDKLFFFINGETDRTISPGNTLLAMDAGRNAADPNVNANVSAADLTTFSALLKSKYKYETGPYENWGGDQDKNDKLLARLDWNINKNNKFTIRYNYSTSSTPSRPSSSGDVSPSISGGRSSKSGGMAFENSQYFTSSTLHSITAELNSRFGKNLDNKLLFAYTKYGQPRTTPSSIFPMIDIMNGTSTAGNVRMTAGYELFSYMNNVDNNTTIITDNLTYLAGKHSLTLGGSMEHQYFANSYLRQGTSYYRFKDLPSFTNFVNGAGDGKPYSDTYDPIGFAYTYPINGFTNPVAELSFRQWSAYLQDEWKGTDNFKITGGLRLDLPQYLSGAVNNPIVSTYSFRNGEKVDLSTWPKAQILWSPRLGFNWDVFKNKNLVVRGGTGIFTGRIPFVWFTNQPTNSGMLQYQLAISASGGATSTAQLARLPMYADPTQLLTNTAISDIFPKSNVVGGKIAGIDKNFKLPQVWRSSIGVDIKLPQNMLLSLDYIYTKDINSIYFDNINWSAAPLKVNLGNSDPIGNQTIPYYSTATAVKYITAPYQNVVVMRNTNKGQGYTLAAKLDLPRIYGFSGSMAYSKTWGEEVTNKSGSDPFSAWQYRVQAGNPNDQSLGLTANNMPNRLMASINYAVKYNKFETSASVFYTGNSGYSYSYIFGGDANSDGTTSNDLMYIPRNQADYIWASQADADAYFAYAAQDPYLKKHAGELAKRNAAYEPWFSKFDLRVVQNFNLKFGANNNKLEFTADFMNVGNLINHNWGLNKGLASSANMPLIVTSTARDAATGMLKVAMRKVGTSYMTSTFQDPTSIGGLWGIQIGLRYSFN